ncbi:MAG: RDD family protein [Boseongicola sp.]|nr:RDD family protein [Boseongicola sp.]NNJ67221.1 RDD family protein [Boseongicola sp.]
MPIPLPETQPEFYEDVNSKRLVAWIIDVIAISAITALLTVLSLFTALFFLPFLYAAVGFIYRWIGLSRNSATFGMRVMSVEFQKSDGEDFDGATAFLHTLGYYASVAIFPAQLVSIVLMLMSERKQGLTDMVLGTVLLNMRNR